jgi:hypothetical protein
MTQISCPSGAQDEWCPKTVADVMPSIIGLLPRGPAWDAAAIVGTVQNTYWAAFASVLAYTYTRLCAFVDEFFCATVVESRDQWIAEYGLNDACDPYGHNLCLKVAAESATTCPQFVALALLSGWVIDCVTANEEPIAGCFEVGCTPLGPTPVYNPLGSRMGVGQQQFCDYGAVVEHPEPTRWQHGATSASFCPVPGSNLGYGPDVDEPCCMIVGWYDNIAGPTVERVDVCRSPGDTIYFDCASSVLPPNDPPYLWASKFGVMDSTGNYTSWGNAFSWTVNVYVKSSRAYQVSNTEVAHDDYTFPAAGNFMAGGIPISPDGKIGGTPLCFDGPVGNTPTFALCFLERIKPAHTTLNYNMVQA